MQLMLEKGLVRRMERYKSHVYEATLTRDEAQAQFADELIHRVFEGSLRNLVMGALTSQRAKPKEMEEIRRMLERFEKGRKSR